MLLFADVFYAIVQYKLNGIHGEIQVFKGFFEVFFGVFFHACLFVCTLPVLKIQKRTYNVNMHKRFVTSGNSWALIIPKPLLELLKINPVLDEVELIVEGEELRIKKYKGEKS
jgi:hypothetical protein